MTFLPLLFIACNSPKKENLSLNHSPIVSPVKGNFSAILPVILFENDSIDSVADKEYGVGDDDLFSNDNFKIYQIKEGKYVDVSTKLNDYDLTTSVVSTFYQNEKDTIALVVDFKGLYNLNKDTVATINGIDIFNGNRANIEEWTKQGSVQDIKILNDNRIIGRATLKKTYKGQTISLENAPIVNLRGKSDTVFVLIESIFNGSAKSNSYSISEVKLQGTKKW